ncbi:hypothetical protein A3D00_00425 [Candidatus Woesebacteria bacterium RIFCSPHIGHO2_02_FULL_38_9]|uniref:TVP38/TMEM64 family membrane protein n=1 Tax=Candidatus Woesebacteria bacterium RIFCSPHIGHO2_01_FULL_39_28 TaxID=1802496 RepID=A0A1F7YK37_9BACT|nr:MAG: hypothetical protein A2627_04675 [Candidatus Woesebacteria bacterium RIFCSPHIGHO2_01_FULL_39_28]OGM33196.1 MAG: hypothetical protein A3D00_00425 [Candidatus Woesebacteria bacterium RIFCSPHIGHO2_02_FULL_38_9]OGM57085.1 MAG: hypothetical protein A3A50_05480 [Candidatus Woesebacteria bacterium RIFCSPLOWO2_01_FULL_38_20]
MKRYFSVKNLKRLLYLLLFFGLIISIPALFLNGKFDVNTIRVLVKKFGVLSPIIFIILSSLTNVIPPLAATPFWIASIILFGPIIGFLLSFVGNLLGSSINFFIAKIWGRSAIVRVAGQRTLTEIDKLPNITNPITVFVLKFVGGAATDYISYGSGLSRIKYFPYIVATSISILPMMGIGFMIIRNISLTSVTSTASALGLFYLINYLSTLLLIPVSYLFFEKPYAVGKEEKKIGRFLRKIHFL